MGYHSIRTLFSIRLFFLEESQVSQCVTVSREEGALYCISQNIGRRSMRNIINPTSHFASGHGALYHATLIADIIINTVWSIFAGQNRWPYIRNAVYREWYVQTEGLVACMDVQLLLLCHPYQHLTPSDYSQGKTLLSKKVTCNTCTRNNK